MNLHFDSNYDFFILIIIFQKKCLAIKFCKSRTTILSEVGVECFLTGPTALI